MMKTETVLIVFLFIISLVLVGYFILDYEKPSPPSRTTAPSSDTNAGTVLDGTILTENRIAQHNKPEDCWLIIADGVYDATSYLSAHPGGAGTILPYCGQDGSQAFQTQDGEGAHSDYATDLLENYRIGTVGEEQLPPSQLSDSITETNSDDPGQGSNDPSAAPANIILSAEEVSQHDTQSDCWMIINNTVYALSSYFDVHPGGAAIMAPYCGRDGTNAFDTQAGQGSHSTNAITQLANYSIGELGNTTTQENITSLTTNPPPVPVDGDEPDEADDPDGGEQDEEDDEDEIDD